MKELIPESNTMMAPVLLPAAPPTTTTCDPSATAHGPYTSR
jgi:hypothetical protein